MPRSSTTVIIDGFKVPGVDKIVSVRNIVDVLHFNT